MGEPQLFEDGADARLGRLSAGMDELLERLEETYASQQRLIRGIGHDLKSPLASIVSMAESLAEGHIGELSAEQAESCRMIAATGRRLIGSLELLYALADARAGLTNSAPCELDVRRIVRETSLAFRPAAEIKGVSLAVDVPDDPVPLFGHATTLERIVANLLDNAVKFTDSGTIRVALAEVCGAARIDVTDTGIGIDGTDVPRVLDEYFRATSATGRPGAGIGLAVTRDLVDGMGGTLEVASAPGAGTRFTVTLPFRPA